MRITHLNSELKFINRIGQTLSVHQRMNLETSTLKLSQQYQFEKFNFWGRIQGINRNYYILEAVNFKGSGNFPTKKYFWSNELFQFSQLPEPNYNYSKAVIQNNNFFTGQHEKILIKSQPDSKVINNNGESLIVRAKNFTELDRLALTVALIEDQCSVVPLGAYIMMPTHQLIANPDFRGLKLDQSKNIDNYVHMRAPKTEEKKLILESDKALERKDFMDAISSDAIKKSWSLQTDESGTEITVRSLLWPGYVGYHRTNSKIFGGAYMGSGLCCLDLPFIL